MSRFEGPQGIVTNGLVLNLDAGDPDSYTRSQPPYVEVLVVAGGGAGGGYHAGGGGAGGVIYNSAYQLTSAAAITVTIGAGGGAATNISNTGDPGSNSVFGSLTAIGGGAGISQGSSPIARNNGGSGGGAADGSGGVNHPGGSGTPGQGFNGGNIFGDGPSQYYLYGTAGGGGAGGNGVGNIITGGGAGGPGSAFSISGTTTYYGGGGGGTYLGPGSLGVLTTDYGIGGVGGGGRGGYTSTAGGTVVVYSTSGTNNTGGGGGGFLYANNGGGAGGSGIVIVRYPGLPAATGGTITYLNGYTIHTFTSSGTFTPYKWNSTSDSSQFNVNNGTQFIPYVNGGTFDLDGTDDYFSTGSLNLQQSWTLEIWANMDDDSAFGLFGQGPQATNQGLHILYTSGGRGMVYGMYANDNDYENNYRPSTGVWYNWVFTYNNSSYDKQFYADSSLQTPGSSVENAYAGSGQFNIGATYSSAFAPANGKIAVSRFYNRVLSQAEVTQNYNSARARFGK
jgi:hypothetical protein